uniref:DUF4283 domain-containing protein n=1 Tax=Ananas comosus var. bracteatus TaxID=296719 RepID=A0A6V7PUA7_ANACO|nr:unnamed protein product [Ananas comosus var. bracteatus]
MGSLAPPPSPPPPPPPAPSCLYPPLATSGPTDPHLLLPHLAPVPHPLPCDLRSSGVPRDVHMSVLAIPLKMPQISPAGAPSLSGCVALAEVRSRLPGNAKEVLSRGLAARFGGESRDYGVADFRQSSLAVFFLNWVARESAIGRSPFRFEALDFFFSKWQESGELERGHLRHKAWIRLHHWPILCWNEEDVKAAVSDFGELWDIDPLSESQADLNRGRKLIPFCWGKALIEDWVSTLGGSGGVHPPIGFQLGLGEAIFGPPPGPRLTAEPWRPPDWGDHHPAARCGDHGQGEYSNSNSNSPCPVIDTLLPSDMPCLLADADPSVTPLASNYPPASDDKGKQVVGLDSISSGPQAADPSESPLASIYPRASGVKEKKVVGLDSTASGPQDADPSETPLASKFPLASDDNGEKVAGLDSFASGPQAITRGAISYSLARPINRSSPNFVLTPASGSKGCGLDSRPPLLPSTLGTIHSAPSNLLPSRRSLRLAAKHRGTKKSSLIRAQETMCKKFKLVRFAAKSACPPPSSSSSSSSAVANEAVPVGSMNGTSLLLEPSILPHPAPPPSPSKDTAFSLTQSEIQQVLDSCGVRPKDGGTSIRAFSAAPGLAADGGAAQVPAVPDL